MRCAGRVSVRPSGLTSRLDWLQELVLQPAEEPVAGQLDLGLVAERVWDRCACGGMVSVDTDGDVAEAIARHQQTYRHKEWRLLGGLGLPIKAEDFGRVPVKAA